MTHTVSLLSPLLLSACVYFHPADVDAFELLKEDLKDDEENVIATINRLLTVALAIGPKRTRDELLPFLKGMPSHACTKCEQFTSYGLQTHSISTYHAHTPPPDFDENNEEAVTAIARQLGDFVEFVGGAEHLPLLFPLLERYAGAEETVIRDAAVESFAKVIPKLVVEDVIGKLLPLIKRTMLSCRWTHWVGFRGWPRLAFLTLNFACTNLCLSVSP